MTITADTKLGEVFKELVEELPHSSDDLAFFCAGAVAALSILKNANEVGKTQEVFDRLIVESDAFVKKAFSSIREHKENHAEEDSPDPEPENRNG